MGDVDSSCVVGIADLIAIASAWNSSNFDPDLDLDFDNQMTIAAVMLGAGNWEASCWE